MFCFIIYGYSPWLIILISTCTHGRCGKGGLISVVACSGSMISLRIRVSCHLYTVLFFFLNWSIVKDPDAGKDCRQEEKGMTEDEMVGWHRWLNRHEFEQALGVGDGQGSLGCCSPWGHKDHAQLSDWTELILIYNVTINLQFTMLVSSVQQSDSVIYIFFFRFFSFIGYNKILSIVLCTIYIAGPCCLSILYNSLYMLIPDS